MKHGDKKGEKRRGGNIENI